MALKSFEIDWEQGKETIEYETNIDYEVDGVDISEYWDLDTLKMMDKHYILKVPKA